MHHGIRTATRILTTAATLAVMVAFLVGLPELTYVPGQDSFQSGEQHVRLLEILLSSAPADPAICPEARIPACLRNELLDGSLFSSLAPDSEAMLVRNLAWLQVWGLVFLAIRTVGSFRTGRELMNELEPSVSRWLPANHVVAVTAAMAGAYFFNHI